MVLIPLLSCQERTESTGLLAGKVEIQHLSCCISQGSLEKQINKVCVCVCVCEKKYLKELAYLIVGVSLASLKYIIYQAGKPPFCS